MFPNQKGTITYFNCSDFGSGKRVKLKIWYEICRFVDVTLKIYTQNLHKLR